MRGDVVLIRLYEVLQAANCCCAEWNMSRKRMSRAITAGDRVLVAILNNLSDLAVARDQHWYRIPVSSVHKWLQDRWPPDWLAFYQTKVLGSFAIYCASGKIDVETDGDTYHTGPDHVPQDNVRHNDLTTVGWKILRFDTPQICEQMDEYCLPKIVENINRLGGVEEGKLVPRRIDLDTPGGLQQLGLFDDVGNE
jgi:hypothetical protein